jgi:hypothetical protein
MRSDLPFLSKFLGKLLEVIGAGLASAAGAFLLGHIAKPATPPPVVQIMPADANTIRMVRGEPTITLERQKNTALSRSAEGPWLARNAGDARGATSSPAQDDQLWQRLM